MSFYLSYEKDIRKRKCDNILFFKESHLCRLAGKKGIVVSEEITNCDDYIPAAISYIENNNLDNVEILLPFDDVKSVDYACEVISNYLEANDNTIGLITKIRDFDFVYESIIERYNITFSLRSDEIYGQSLGLIKEGSSSKEKLKPRNSDIKVIDGEDFFFKKEKTISFERNDLIIEDSFNEKFINLLNQTGKSNVEVYTEARITKQVFSKALSTKGFIPKKDTIICLIIGMKVSYDDALELLGSAGYTLSKSIIFDVVVNKYLKRGIYDVDRINSELEERHCPLLGWKPRD